MSIKWIGYCGEYGMGGEVLSTIYKKLRATLRPAVDAGDCFPVVIPIRRSAERDLATPFDAHSCRNASHSKCEVPRRLRGSG